MNVLKQLIGRLIFSLYFSIASWRLFFVGTLFCNDEKINN